MSTNRYTVNVGPLNNTDIDNADGDSNPNTGTKEGQLIISVSTFIVEGTTLRMTNGTLFERFSLNGSHSF